MAKKASRTKAKKGGIVLCYQIPGTTNEEKAACHKANAYEKLIIPKPGNKPAWKAIGKAVLEMSIKGKPPKTETRAQFIKRIGAKNASVPGWIKTVAYHQSNVKSGRLNIALPAKEFAIEAKAHANNPKASGYDYPPPPIYSAPQGTPEDIMLVRLCDYTMSFCQ
jgi:hypothetical protein